MASGNSWKLEAPVLLLFCCAKSLSLSSRAPSLQFFQKWITIEKLIYCHRLDKNPPQVCGLDPSFVQLLSFIFHYVEVKLKHQPLLTILQVIKQASCRQMALCINQLEPISTMKMEVQVVSRQNVKPSSPTPPHLRIYKLSILDQLMPVPYAPIIFFYPSNGNDSCFDTTRRLELLKRSLSETLTCFYPLAGKIRDDLSIECDDGGACFVETRVSCQLNEFLTQPDHLSLHQFIPCDFFTKESTVGTCVTSVQANVFECRGIAVGTCLSHRIVDGAALSIFLNSWSARARGFKKAICPDFISTSSLFPAHDLWLRDASIVLWGSMLKKGNCITRRFVFDSAAIANLKSMAAGSCSICPSRVEVVSAFLWKCMMAASGKMHGSQRSSVLTHMVNLRRRWSPPLTDNSMGNKAWIAHAHYNVNRQHKEEPVDLVGDVRKAVSKINADFVYRLKGHEGKHVMSESFKEIHELTSEDGVDHYGFSSWCNFGFYHVDFGWGSPVWVTSCGMRGSVFLNLVILNDTRVGDGVEAWVTLDEQEMAILVDNQELFKFASLDPSPLAIGTSILHT